MADGKTANAWSVPPVCEFNGANAANNYSQWFPCYNTNFRLLFIIKKVFLLFLGPSQREGMTKDRGLLTYVRVYVFDVCIVDVWNDFKRISADFVFAIRRSKKNHGINCSLSSTESGERNFICTTHLRSWAVVMWWKAMEGIRTESKQHFWALTSIRCASGTQRNTKKVFRGANVSTECHASRQMNKLTDRRMWNSQWHIFIVS